MVDAPAQRQLRFYRNFPTLGVFYFAHSYGSFALFNQDHSFK